MSERQGRRGRGAAWRRRGLWVLAAVAAVAVVLWFTVREDRYVLQDNLTGPNLVPLEHHLEALRCVLEDCPGAAVAARWLLVDVVGNVLLFVPVGLAFAGAAPGRSGWRRWLWAVVAAVVLSVGIEVVQWFIPTRATDVDDVLFNAAGAVLGAGVAVGVGAGR